MIIFFSKIDSWLTITFIIISLILLVCPIFYHRKKHISLVESYFVLFLPTAFALLLIWLPFFNTYYQLSQNELLIHNGFYNTVIPRNTILSIRPSHSLEASPALSLDRLEISYQKLPNKIEYILISPEHTSEFLQQFNHD